MGYFNYNDFSSSRQPYGARAQVQAVMRACPSLGYAGFGEGWSEFLLSDEGLAQFEKSCEWLGVRRLWPGEPGKWFHSYHLKHRAHAEIGYSHSGPFICAAFVEQMPIKPVEGDPDRDQTAPGLSSNVYLLCA